jgi:O-antigen/teichoic acid export membrane protein
VSDGAPPPRGRRGLRTLIEDALPKERFGDHLTLLSGTGQNIVGLGVFVAASLGTSVLISNILGAPALGLVTLATQFAFIGGAGTRFGMDMAAVRRVAIDVGKGEPGRSRGVVRRAAGIAAGVSFVVALAMFVGASWLADVFAGHSPHGVATRAFEGAALALPFVALCQVYLGGTRGLKIMRHTLFVYWSGQPIAWIVLMLVGWAVSTSVGVSMLAYAGSWILATVAAWALWEHESRRFPRMPAGVGETRELLRYGAPRAPAALLSQLLFWTDYFVLSAVGNVSAAQLGVYAAAVRVAQALVLFLIAVNYMFSPFVADLHARGERDKLNGLYKALTRWTLAGTIPILLLLMVVPGAVLHIFGSKGFESGTTELRILLIGQFVNVAVGSVGFILIMVGRTGWDLVVYAGSFLLDLVVALALVPKLGADGAAIAQATTLTVSNAVRLILVWRFVRIQPFSRPYFRLAIPAAAGLATMIAVNLVLSNAVWWADLIVTGAIGSIVYAVVLLALALSPTERTAVERILRGRRGPAEGIGKAG